MTKPIKVPVKYMLRAGSRIKRTRTSFASLTTRWEDFTTTKHAFFTEDDLIRTKDSDMVMVRLPLTLEYKQIQFDFVQLERTFTGTLHGVGI